MGGIPHPGTKPAFTKSDMLCGASRGVPYNATPRGMQVPQILRGRRRTHETRPQDCRPDRWVSGHIFDGHRSSGSRRGWRPSTSVPTQSSSLPIQLANLTYGKPVWDRKVTKVTLP